MKRFNVDKELKKLNGKRFITSNKKTISSILLPIFMVGFSCAALMLASYSLDDSDYVIDDNNNEVSNVINDDLGQSKYFYNNEDKYVSINNMLFRVIRINGDGSIRLILDTDIIRDYNLSIEDNLNNWFNMYFSSNKYVTKSIYDNNIYVGNEEVTDLMNMTSAKIGYVGLLSYREYKLTYIYDDNSRFYLNSYDIYGNYLCNNSGMISSCTVYEDYGIRPVINIKIDRFIGEGTRVNPFVIEEE